MRISIIVNFGVVHFGDFCMLNHSSRKSGFTLVEVVIVVAIMGVLATMGVAGLRGAVANSRMKDCAINTAAFLERIANDANRMSKRLCVRVSPSSEQELQVYEAVGGSCEVDDPDEFYETFDIDGPARFGCDDVDLDIFDGNDWAQNGAMFVPRIGISAAPTEGFVCMQYGNQYVYGLIEKKKNNNMIVPMWRAGDFWSKL